MSGRCAAVNKLFSVWSVVIRVLVAIFLIHPGQDVPGEHPEPIQSPLWQVQAGRVGQSLKDAAAQQTDVGGGFRGRVHQLQTGWGAEVKGAEAGTCPLPSHLWNPLGEPSQICQ